MVALGVVLLGSALEVVLDVAYGGVVVLDQGKVDLHALAGIEFVEGFRHTRAVDLRGDLGSG